MRFKVGDTVRIRPDISTDDFDVVPGMLNYAGETALIVDAVNIPYMSYVLDVDDGVWFWHESLVRIPCFTNLLDGKAMAAEIRANTKQTVDILQQRCVCPSLMIFTVGEDPASQVYVRNKMKACKEVGIDCFHQVLPADTTTEQLVDAIEEANEDDDITGVIIQLPLPDHIDTHKVTNAIDPYKDVDCLNPVNVGRLTLGLPGPKPCTPKGIMHMLHSTGVSLAGKHAVIVGRSDIVGKPMVTMLLQENCTVTVCHSHTADLAAHTKQGNILIVAAGKPGLITADMVKSGAVVVDVGINRVDGHLLGDCASDVALMASWLTPVPGGVGPMTVAMLLDNIVQAAERKFYS